MEKENINPNPEDPMPPPPPSPLKRATTEAKEDFPDPPVLTRQVAYYDQQSVWDRLPISEDRRGPILKLLMELKENDTKDSEEEDEKEEQKCG